MINEFFSVIVSIIMGLGYIIEIYILYLLFDHSLHYVALEKFNKNKQFFQRFIIIIWL